MEAVKHKCGFCGAETSYIYARGKKIQQAWYKDEKFGFLCKQCYNRKNRNDGDIMKARDVRQAKAEAERREANLKLYGTGWRCTEAFVRKCRDDGLYYTDGYAIMCEHCGKKIKWHDTIDAFLADKESACNCTVMKWVLESNMIPQSEQSLHRIAKFIADNPELSQSEVSRELNISRQRVEQIVRQAKTMYILYSKGVIARGSNQSE